jgi:hypothetical protein
LPSGLAKQAVLKNLGGSYFLRRLAGAYHDGATAEQFNTLIAMAYAAVVLVLLFGGLIVCGTHLPQASPAEAGGLSARSGLLCIGSIVVLAILFLVVMLANNSVRGLTGVPWGIQYVKAVASLLGIFAPEEE